MREHLYKWVCPCVTLICQFKTYYTSTFFKLWNLWWFIFSEEMYNYYIFQTPSSSLSSSPPPLSSISRLFCLLLKHPVYVFAQKTSPKHWAIDACLKNVISVHFFWKIESSSVYLFHLKKTFFNFINFLNFYEKAYFS